MEHWRYIIFSCLFHIQNFCIVIFAGKKIKFSVNWYATFKLLYFSFFCVRWPLPDGARQDNLYWWFLRGSGACNFSGPACPASLLAVLRIHDISMWIRIRIRGSMPLTNGSGSFYFHHWISRCQQKTKKKKSFSAYYFLKVLLHHFSNVISQKDVTKQ